jgi:hypothetical protein
MSPAAPRRRQRTVDAGTSLADAHRAEITDEGISFEYDGHRYELGNPQRWDLDVFEAVEDQRIVSACKLLLGPAQWARFRRKHRTMPELIAMFTVAWGAAGVSPGE